jgi:hypothetical protein
MHLRGDRGSAQTLVDSQHFEIGDSPTCRYKRRKVDGVERAQHPTIGRQLPLSYSGDHGFLRLVPALVKPGRFERQSDVHSNEESRRCALRKIRPKENLS